jgi:hypothetical protein
VSGTFRNLVAGQRTGRTVETSSTVQKRRTGYSEGFDVVGPDGRAWDIKIGKEAQTEIVVSRILWALGYHQPTLYYMTGWKLAGEWEGEGEPARFRLQSDHQSDGEWAWLENPFTNSMPFRGLIAINLLLSNWDFKTSNNRVYRAETPGDPVRRYVVQDLGASLGKPRLPRSTNLLALLPGKPGTRNDIDDYEETHLVTKVRGSEVTPDYRGPRGDILETMNVADVVWACELMNRLRDGQLDERSGGRCEPALRTRFVAKIRSRFGKDWLR